MIRVSIKEAEVVRAKCPDACIAKTRHKRYLEESMKYMVLIPNNFEAAQMIEAARRKNERKKKFDEKHKRGGKA